MYTNYASLLILTSLILLLAMVGTIIITINNNDYSKFYDNSHIIEPRGELPFASLSSSPKPHLIASLPISSSSSSSTIKFLSSNIVLTILFITLLFLFDFYCLDGYITNNFIIKELHAAAPDQNDEGFKAITEGSVNSVRPAAESSGPSVPSVAQLTEEFKGITSLGQADDIVRVHRDNLTSELDLKIKENTNTREDMQIWRANIGKLNDNAKQAIENLLNSRKSK